MRFGITCILVALMLSWVPGCRPMASKTNDDLYEAIDGFYEVGEFAEAIRYCDVAIDREPYNYAGYLARAECNLQLDNLELALKDAEHALELEPRKYEPYQVRSQIWSAMGKHKRAIEDINLAMELQPNYFVHYTSRGYEFEQLGHYRRAFQDYLQAFQLNQNDFLTWNNYASIRAMAPDGELRNGKKAITAAKKAIKLAEDDEMRAWAWDTLAAAYAETGNFKKAIKSAEKALSLAADRDRQEISDRMELYKAGKPARLPSEIVPLDDELLATP